MRSAGLFRTSLLILAAKPDAAEAASCSPPLPQHAALPPPPLRRLSGGGGRHSLPPLYHKAVKAVNTSWIRVGSAMVTNQQVSNGHTGAVFLGGVEESKNGGSPSPTLSLKHGGRGTHATDAVFTGVLHPFRPWQSAKYANELARLWHTKLLAVATPGTKEHRHAFLNPSVTSARRLQGLTGMPTLDLSHMAMTVDFELLTSMREWSKGQGVGKAAASSSSSSSSLTHSERATRRGEEGPSDRREEAEAKDEERAGRGSDDSSSRVVLNCDDLGCSGIVMWATPAGSTPTKAAGASHVVKDLATDHGTAGTAPSTACEAAAGEPSGTQPSAPPSANRKPYTLPNASSLGGMAPIPRDSRGRIIEVAGHLSQYNASSSPSSATPGSSQGDDHDDDAGSVMVTIASVGNCRAFGIQRAAADVYHQGRDGRPASTSTIGGTVADPRHSPIPVGTRRLPRDHYCAFDPYRMSRRAHLKPLSCDHTVQRIDEAARVRVAGGFVNADLGYYVGPVASPRHLARSSALAMEGRGGSSSSKMDATAAKDPKRYNVAHSLTRAYGLFALKANFDVSPAAQIVTALPDMSHWTMRPGDILVMSSRSLYGNTAAISAAVANASRGTPRERNDDAPRGSTGDPAVAFVISAPPPSPIASRSRDVSTTGGATKDNDNHGGLPAAASADGLKGAPTSGSPREGVQTEALSERAAAAVIDPQTVIDDPTMLTTIDQIVELVIDSAFRKGRTESECASDICDLAIRSGCGEALSVVVVRCVRPTQAASGGAMDEAITDHEAPRGRHSIIATRSIAVTRDVVPGPLYPSSMTRDGLPAPGAISVALPHSVPPLPAGVTESPCWTYLQVLMRECRRCGVSLPVLLGLRYVYLSTHFPHVFSETAHVALPDFDGDEQGPPGLRSMTTSAATHILRDYPLEMGYVGRVIQDEARLFDQCPYTTAEAEAVVRHLLSLPTEGPSTAMAAPSGADDASAGLTYFETLAANVVRLAMA